MGIFSSPVCAAPGREPWARLGRFDRPWSNRVHAYPVLGPFDRQHLRHVRYRGLGNAVAARSQFLSRRVEAMLIMQPGVGAHHRPPHLLAHEEGAGYMTANTLFPSPRGQSRAARLSGPPALLTRHIHAPRTLLWQRHRLLHARL